MIANEHDRDERQDGEKGHQEPRLGGHGEELQPEGAGAPRVEGEPTLDAVGEVPALPQLLPEKVDGAVRHGAEYSTRSGVLSRDFSMNSADSVTPSVSEWPGVSARSTTPPSRPLPGAPADR